MIGYTVTFLVLAAACAGFTFTPYAAGYEAPARIAAIVFTVLAALSLVAHLVTKHRPMLAGVARSGALAIVSGLIGAGIYGWIDNDMSAEKLGRMLDRSARNISSDAGGAIGEVAKDASEGAKSTLSEIQRSTGLAEEPPEPPPEEADPNGE